MLKQFRWAVCLALLWLAGCATAPAETTTALVVPSATPGPAPLAEIATAIPLSPQPTSEVEPKRIPAPLSGWTALLHLDTGSLELEAPQGETYPLFPDGSTVTGVRWTPDGQQLAVALSNWPARPGWSETQGIPEIWLATPPGDEPDNELQFLYRPRNESAPAQIVLGPWSPDNQRLLFWMGPASASIQADGLPLWSLEIAKGKATQLSQAALSNPAYQSWAPDGSALAFTDGGYRSAQIGKWLSLYQVSSAEVTTLVPTEQQVPGALAWSPDGRLIAYAAVAAGETGEKWADWMDWDNPAILARRIYLLDAQTGQYRRLNQESVYQDAPTWRADGTQLYYVQMADDGVTLMAADPNNGEAQPLPGCQAPLPTTAGYYGQVDWSELYQNCPGVAPSTPPSPEFIPSTSPNQTAAGPQIEAIQSLRTLFGLPDLPLDYVETTGMVNSPSGGLSVAVYQDSEGRKYLVDPTTDQVVEIDARAAPPVDAAQSASLSPGELSAKAQQWMQAILPDFSAREASLSYEEGAKSDDYFFTWRDALPPGAFNAPFAQIGLHKNGALFAYYNTLTVDPK